jgi:hypothetical protein
MDSGPGDYAPSRNDEPLDVSGFMESITQCPEPEARAHRAANAIARFG